MAEQEVAAHPMEIGRVEDFLSVYANNVMFEQSAWDCKMIFGQLDQHGGKAVIKQKASVTLPWLQMKLLTFYLQVNLAAYEMENGKINVPQAVRPAVPPLPPDLESNPKMKAAFERINQMREEFLASL